MLRLAYASRDSDDRSIALDRDVIRFGTDPDCELTVVDPEAQISGRHGEFIRAGDAWLLVATDAGSGLWLDGKRVRRAELRGGERIRVGSPTGPEIRVLPADPVEVAPLEHHPPTSRGVRAPRAPGPAGRARSDRALPPLRKGEDPTPASGPKRSKRPLPELHVEPVTTIGRAMRALTKPQAEVQHWLRRAQQELKRARQRSGGGSSGHTMVIMASALHGIRQSAEGRAHRTRRTLRWVAWVSAALIASLATVVWSQHQRLSQLMGEKAALDGQIETVFAAMSKETDDEKLAALEARLQSLMGSAAEKLLQLDRANARRARELAEPADELERDIRTLLRSFNAETYALPPLFKQALQRHIDELRSSAGVRGALAQKRKHWGAISGALRRHQLPTELGYIAFAESRFDPDAVNARTGASGLWQLMDESARQCGISVEPGNDERLDPARSSQAAACYLSKLMIEFGEQSFMLALASYNRGENGVRRALHKLAREPGGYKKRDFWHLYRLKLLPPETREYVPRVLAAAIVLERPERYGLGPRSPAAAQ